MKKFAIATSTVLSLFLLFAYCIPTTSENISLHPMFTNHMVLQQQQDVPIWGKNEPNSAVSIKASWGAESTVTTDIDGNWKIILSTPTAGGPFELEINSGKQSIFLTDVMIGEVWLASGQSNMEMPLTGFLPKEPIDNYEEEIINADFPAIRMFTVKRNLSAEKEEKVEGKWLVCTPKSAKYFSATGYFFARKLYQKLNVPIGIIHSSWGGSVAEAWTSKEGLTEFSHFLEIVNSFDGDEIPNWAKQFKTVPKPTSLNEFEKIDRNSTVFSASDFDDSTWVKIDLPSAACRTTDFIPNAPIEQKLHGIFWYRKNINLKIIDGDYTLVIGAIDDGDVTYVNGKKVGSTWLWNKKRKYNVPKSILKKGINTIAINHYDGGGGSAISGPMTLKNTSGDTISLEGTWSGFFRSDLYDQLIIIYDENDHIKLKNRPMIGSGGPNELPTSLYNAMIHPLLPFTIKGAIWYQGESNVGRDEEYKKLLPAMILDWRNAWGYDFPFYFVQIAPFGYGNDHNNVSQKLREAQRLSLRTNNTGMAVTLDIGNKISIHPPNKQAVGDRLARLALANDYNVKIVANGPLYKAINVKGDKLILTFHYAAGGLVLKDSDSPQFEIAGADKKFMPANAIVKGTVLELSSENVAEPKYARYGWRDFLNGSLFNDEGLPASSFSTE